MKKSVFISHAHEDQHKIELICRGLKDKDFDFWVSFKDIVPGENWDTAIQKALDAASHVVVFVSRRSISSSYVLAEIEYALNSNKTVIPVLLEKVDKMPLRWYTLQYLDISDYDNAPEPYLNRIASLLPKSSIAQLSNYLQARNDATSLQTLLLEHPSWFGYGFLSQNDIKKLTAFLETDFKEFNLLHTLLLKYPEITDDPSLFLRLHEEELLPQKIRSFLYDEFGLEDSPVYFLLMPQLFPLISSLSVFGARPRTGYLEVHLIYLFSPFEVPFHMNGTIESAFKILMAEAQSATDAVIKTFQEPKSWKYGIGVHCKCFAGLRDMYTPVSVNHRRKFQETWIQNNKLKQRNAGAVLEIRSYTTLLDQVITDDRKSAWTWH